MLLCASKCLESSYPNEDRFERGKKANLKTISLASSIWLTVSSVSVREFAESFENILEMYPENL